MRCIRPICSMACSNCLLFSIITGYSRGLRQEESRDDQEQGSASARDVGGFMMKLSVLAAHENRNFDSGECKQKLAKQKLEQANAETQRTQKQKVESRNWKREERLRSYVLF